MELINGKTTFFGNLGFTSRLGAMNLVRGAFSRVPIVALLSSIGPFYWSLSTSSDLTQLEGWNTYIFIYINSFSYFPSFSNTNRTGLLSFPSFQEKSAIAMLPISPFHHNVEKCYKIRRIFRIRLFFPPKIRNIQQDGDGYASCKSAFFETRLTFHY